MRRVQRHFDDKDIPPDELCRVLGHNLQHLDAVIEDMEQQGRSYLSIMVVEKLQLPMPLRECNYKARNRPLHQRMITVNTLTYCFRQFLHLAAARKKAREGTQPPCSQVKRWWHRLYQLNVRIRHHMGCPHPALHQSAGICVGAIKPSLQVITVSQRQSWVQQQEARALLVGAEMKTPTFWHQFTRRCADSLITRRRMGPSIVPWIPQSVSHTLRRQREEKIRAVIY